MVKSLLIPSYMLLYEDKVEAIRIGTVIFLSDKKLQKYCLLKKLYLQYAQAIRVRF